MDNKYNRTKHILSVLSFIAALILATIALFLPPQGIIDPSVLYFTAQLLVFTSGFLGVDFNIHIGKFGASTTYKNKIHEDKED